MGNRIHTVLGFGFDKVQFKKDKRFNSHVWTEDFYEKNFLPEMVKLNNSRYKPKDYDFDANLFKAKVEGKGWYNNEKPVDKLSWSDFAQYSGYAGESKFNPLVFTNPFQKDWKRHDDIIDYYIFFNKKGPIEKVRYLTGDTGLPINIYPYALYFNKLTGERVNCMGYDRFGGDDEHNAKRFGFNSVKEWRENVVPEIPYEIRLFCEVANVFVNPLTVWELRPMIYTYWC